MVEYRLAKARVAGSNPVSRSFYLSAILLCVRVADFLSYKIRMSKACVCLARTPSANCYLIVVQFDKCNLGYVLLTP